MYALVIAGGKGERLRPLTEDRPKPMVEVAGRPIIDYHLRWLAAQGVTHAVLLCGYQAQIIQDYCGDGRRWGLHILYHLEEEPLGRGGALRAGFALVPPEGEPIIGTNGDVITDQPLAPLLAFHRAKGALATVMLTPFVSPYGLAHLGRDGRIARFREKPRLPYWVNAGVYVLSGAFFAYLPEVGDHETTAFPHLAAEGRLYGFKSRAFWKSIDTLKDLAEAAERLAAWSPPAGPAPARGHAGR